VEWKRAWSDLREASGGCAGPAWVVVLYADWREAQAPHPDDVLAFALETRCAGLLIDTWDKRRPNPVDESWADRISGVQRTGRFVALAGGLDEVAIQRLLPLRPDLFAVRGAACAGSNRLATIDPVRVARLVRVARSAPDGTGFKRASRNLESRADSRR
jgi:uncharacterized protein (UPF0264 family)